eukprot:493576-Amorphochlora_amoeboformis.AAC.1
MYDIYIYARDNNIVRTVRGHTGLQHTLSSDPINPPPGSHLIIRGSRVRLGVMARIKGRVK